jgi:ubiquinone/menaquinone biosynthesis C-methylase UbiE
MPADTPRICDYEGSDYRTRFWEGQGRSYEDLVERAVLQRLLPTSGQRMLEIGAGFGRLTPEYRAYQQVVLLDYSFSQLQYARQHYGDDGFLYVAANAYQLPFMPGVFDGATMIRVIHHFENVPGVLQQISRVMQPQGRFILEFANKRNLKALLRHALGRQSWNPNALDPVEFVELNYNFHPAYMQAELQRAGFITQESIPVSFFRLGILKRTIPAGILAGLDGMMQRTDWLVSPGIFTLNTAHGNPTDHLSLMGEAIFACPQTGAPLRREGDTLVNPDGLRWQIRDGIYDFKAPIH